MIKPYEIHEDDPMTVAEDIAPYGTAALAVDYNIAGTAANEWDDAPAQWDINDPEMQELIELGIHIGLEQVKRGQTYTMDEVWNYISEKHGWN